MEQNLAVRIKDACKSYGNNEVLKNLNMQVQKGTIYGLLGASGCGKTTLLSCIVGRRHLHSGELWVLGGVPGTKESGVPGPKVGFMPQDAGLVAELTVKDTIYFFGRVMNMSDKLIKERYKTLTEVMDLPPSHRYVKDCSGGQQRRVSFAAAMIHLPELLILDEPTVGVDPILRERIWDYLLKVTRTENMAVIITTHYIEEARQANTIGLLRDGKLLAQETPGKLLSIFHTDSLEEVFLILSRHQEAGRLDEATLPQIESSSMSSFDEIGASTEILTKDKKSKRKTKSAGGYSLNRKRMKALLDKNWKQFHRNITTLIFVMAFPVLQITSFLLAIGGDVMDIDMAIINDESTCFNFTLPGSAMPSEESCNLTNLSCRFMTYLDTPMIHKITYTSLPQAFEDIQHGKIVGALYMSENYTESFQERLDSQGKAGREVVDRSQIKVWLDMSNSQIGLSLKFKLFNLFNDFQMDLFRDCEYDPKFAEVIKLETINGRRDDNFQVFTAPGAVLTTMFFMSALLTTSIIITERCEGIWDRAVIAGVTSLELTLTHFAIQIWMVVFYCIKVLAITFGFFKMEYVGSMTTMTILAFLQGIAGLGFGFWISIISNSHTMALVVATGCFIFMIFICGFMWPIQGMPWALQWIAKCMPFTVPIISFRNVMKKGWGIENIEVWNGVVIEIIWIIGLAVINMALIRSKR